VAPIDHEMVTAGAPPYVRLFGMDFEQARHTQLDPAVLVERYARRRPRLSPN